MASRSRGGTAGASASMRAASRVSTRAAGTHPQQRLHLHFADGMAPARIENAGQGTESQA